MGKVDVEIAKEGRRQLLPHDATVQHAAAQGHQRRAEGLQSNLARYRRA